jgi:Tol biopolymer transport system component
VIRRGFAVACALALSFTLLASSAIAAAPEGPRLLFTKATETSFQLISSDPGGNDQLVLVGGSKKDPPVPNPFSAASWSGTGFAAFAALNRWEGGDLSIYRVAADGSGLRKIAGTEEGFRPVLSPDGRKLAFGMLKQRTKPGPDGKDVLTFSGASTWVVKATGGRAKRITPWKDGLFEYPASFSPDGSRLGLSVTERFGKRGSRETAVAVRPNGSGAKVIAKNATAPVFSPDGTRVALLLTDKPKTFKSGKSKTTLVPSDLGVAAADGSGLVRITRTADLELLPSWDPSGERLAYVQQRASGRLADSIGLGDSIMQINADGSCRTKVLSERGVILYGPTWQPGPGREAGRINC